MKQNHPNPHHLSHRRSHKDSILKNILHKPSNHCGRHTYYDDPDDVHNFEKNVLYLFDFVGDKLIIGKFCQIATGVRFIMNGSNHGMDGFYLSL